MTAGMDASEKSSAVTDRRYNAKYEARISTSAGADIGATLLAEHG